MTALLISTALILLNGIFVAAEFAIVGAPRAAIERRAATRQQDRARGTCGARRSAAAGPIHRHRATRHHRGQPRASACTASTCLPIGCSACSVGPGSREWLISHGVASVLAVAILTYFHIVVGEMVPKSLALQQAERMVAVDHAADALAAQRCSIRSWSRLNGIGNAGAARCSASTAQAQNADQYYTPEELQFIVQESEELGALRVESGQMLQELFEFGDLTAGEVMVPRVRVTGLPLGTHAGADAGVARPLAAHALSGLSRAISITSSAWCTSRICCGVLLRDEAIARAHARPLPLVPETAHSIRCSSTMRRERTQMVIVLDEHGGTAGCRHAPGSVRGSGRRYRGGPGERARCLPRCGGAPARAGDDADRRARTGVRPRAGARGRRQRQRPGADAARPAAATSATPSATTACSSRSPR